MRRGGAAGVLVRGERVGARRAIMHKACTYGVNPNADARLAARVAAQSCPDFNSTQYPTQRLPLPYVVAGAIDGRNLFPIRPTFLVPQVPGFLFQSHDFPPPPLSFSPCHGITELFARMQSTATICTGDQSAAAFGSFVDRGTPRCHTHILDAHIFDRIHTYSMKSRKYTHYFTGDPNAAACVHVVHGIDVCHRGGQRFLPP